MDITGIPMSLANIQTGNDIGVAVLSKAMDNTDALAQGLMQMIDSAAMERSVTPWIGGNFDATV